MSERGLFKEATCVRETRELVCRLPTDKSVARAFFNCVPPTPAPCPPPFNSPLPLTPSTWPHYFSLSSFFLFLFFFFVLSESVLSEYRSTYPKDVGGIAKQGRFYGFSIVERKKKKGKNVKVRERERESEGWRVNRRDRIFIFHGRYLCLYTSKPEFEMIAARQGGYLGRSACRSIFIPCIVPLSRPRLLETMILFLFRELSCVPPRIRFVKFHTVVVFIYLYYIKLCIYFFNLIQEILRIFCNCCPPYWNVKNVSL